MRFLIILLALTVAVQVLPCTAQNSTPHPRTRILPASPELTTRLALDNQMEQAGADALRIRDFAAAEADFRDAIAASSWAPGYYGLGEALMGQGKIMQAIEAYRAGIYGPPYTVTVLNDIPLHGQFNPTVRDCANPIAAKAWMEYALLLSQTGQEAEADAVYKKALPQVPGTHLPGHNDFLTSSTLSPTELQAAAHIALGLCATFSGDARGGSHDKALNEFNQALRLAPDVAVTNYYSGFGLKLLGKRVEAQAAFKKAAALGGGDIKQAAEKELPAAPQPR